MKYFIHLFIIIFISQCIEPEEIPAPNFAASKSEMSEVDQEKDPACSECNYIVTTQVTDGDSIGIHPGDVICLKANQEYSSLKFKNIKGSASEPVIIRNYGGVAVINSKGLYGVKFENSKHFKLIGNGNGPNSLGIKISTENGFFLTMENFTTAFEIAQVEIAGNSAYGLDRINGGFAGIGIKTSPYQDCELFTDESRNAWIMKDVSIHNNYIHDTGGEGIYIGHGFYTGRKEKECPTITYSHSIQGLLVYENLIENVGYDGLQIKNADKDVSVFRNIIRNYGTRKFETQNEGLFIGEGTTGKFFLNTIVSGSGDGIKVQGIGDLDIFKNKILYPDKDGINVSLGEYGYRKPRGYFNIDDNIIYKPNENGFVFYNDQGGDKEFRDNKIVGPGGYFVKFKPKEVQLFNNKLTYRISFDILEEIGNLNDACQQLRFNPLR